jgi:hypothetical protein
LPCGKVSGLIFIGTGRNEMERYEWEKEIEFDCAVKCGKGEDKNLLPLLSTFWNGRRKMEKD